MFFSFSDCVLRLSGPFLLNPFEHRVEADQGIAIGRHRMVQILGLNPRLNFRRRDVRDHADTIQRNHLDFRAATSTVPSGSMLTAIMGFRGFACASCFSSVEVWKSYVDSHDPEDTAARKYWLP